MRNENILFNYKGYEGTLNYAPHTNSYWGRVLIENNVDLIYYGKSRELAQCEFEKLIDMMVIENEI